MSKTVISPVARFPGSIVLHDPLSLPMVVQLETAIKEAQDVGGAAGDLLLLPGLLACVEGVEITGIPTRPTPDTWPGSPRKAALELLRWLTGEVLRIYAGEIEIPNA